MNIKGSTNFIDLSRLYFFLVIWSVVFKFSVSESMRSISTERNSFGFGLAMRVF